LLQAQTSSEVHYAAAGNFVAFLRDRYGMDRVMRLYALSKDASLGEAKAAFAEAFGETFDAVAEHYILNYVGRRVGSLDCDYPDMEPVGDGWQRTFHAACDDPDSVGPYFGLAVTDTPYLTTSAVFETDHPGDYQLSVVG